MIELYEVLQWDVCTEGQRISIETIDNYRTISTCNICGARYVFIRSSYSREYLYLAPKTNDRVLVRTWPQDLT
jgi:hypothetical protein